MRNQKKPMGEGEGEDRTVFSKIAQTEVPLWPFRWLGMAALFVAGLLVGAFFTVCTLAIGGPYIVVVAGAALSITRNRYVRALGVGVLVPALLGMLGMILLLWERAGQ